MGKFTNLVTEAVHSLEMVCLQSTVPCYLLACMLSLESADATHITSPIPELTMPKNRASS